MKKPLVIVLAEAEQTLAGAVNAVIQQTQLPCYLIEPIIDKIHRQVLDGKTAELAAAKAAEDKPPATEEMD